MRVNANGIDMHCTLEGPESAPTVMMSHSLAVDLSMWDAQTTALTGKYRILRYDTRGHGRSDAPDGPYSMELLVDDAVMLMDALEVDKVHWVGISMGGMIGQALALAHPARISSLALCDTTSEMPAAAEPVWRERIDTARTEGMEPLVAPTIERWFSPGFVEREKAIVDRVRVLIRATPVAGFTGCSHAIMALNLTDRLSSITRPTLIIVGEDDPGTPVSASELIHEKIRGSELVILPVARHLTNMEMPREFNAALSGFLAKV